ncbi:acyl-CoA dehydrogenase family protein [Pontibaca methylaminivorans]|uniref:Putative acyl-CoA dehydrogenase n=1 Tax=Pontibaca methylaminivorans TaxID=515897 RepID=A0A1R3WCR8_9RHOB|nr:acyl-CoA dehydrogenase family protein [Pontibaca methylaminivorans]SIT75705.1 putative acyl-CoA dehydrogenase [Pontibaca methylaminivorans]
MAPNRPVPAGSGLRTHEVTNQPLLPVTRDLWAGDVPLREAVAHFGGRGRSLETAAAAYGSAAMVQAAAEARRDPPRLLSWDSGGRRLDEVAYNAGYHHCMETAARAGYAASARDGAPGGQVTHAAHVYLLSQIEPGTCCPLTMTYAAWPALGADPGLAALWQPRLAAADYDPSLRPVAEKSAVTMGMAMTEKQGGSDLRAVTTRAVRDGDHYRLTGHKWFCSAPMSDGFLTLAQAPGGLTCFVVPRWLSGARNGIRLQRLKDKLGNRANASAEIEYEDALAFRLGDEGDGVRRIIEMVHHTRLDTAIAPAGLMRAALVRALWWVRGRSAFQRRLIDQPLMRRVLADIALDCEAALASAMAMARAFDGTGDEDRALARVGVALAKFLNNKRAVPVIAEAMEVLGGMGYIEDTDLPMFYREAPLNGIWEGSGNVICLDVLRTLQRQPLAGEALDHMFDAARGMDRGYDGALERHRARWRSLPGEAEARLFAESLATLMSAAALIPLAPAAVSGGYVATRLAEGRGRIAGAYAGPGLDEAAILARIG